MPYTLEKLPDAPIILYTVQPGSDPIREMPATITDIVRLLDEQAGKVFLIFDVRTASLGLNDIMHAANATARGQNALMHHANLRENVFVATDSFLRMGIKGLSSPTFGQVRLALFDTLEEALDYCHAQLRAGQI